MKTDTAVGGSRVDKLAKRHAKARLRAKLWRKDNPERLRALCRAWNAANPERVKLRIRTWRKNNPEKVRLQTRTWRKNNPEKVKSSARNWWAAQTAQKTNPYFAKNLRTRIYLALKRCKRAFKYSELLGCSINKFKAHIEARFSPGMTWENYGPVWHVDHIRPCDCFDLSKPEEQKACFHVTNLQPLWARDNIVKGAKQ